MLLKRSLLSVIMISFFAFTACNTGQQKEGDSGDKENQEVSDKLKKERKELQEKANERLASINEKVIELTKR